MDMIRVTSNNWEEIISSPLSLVIFTKNECKDCKQWLDKLNVSDRFEKMIYAVMNLSDKGLGKIKIENPWISQIDILPFNVLFVEGELQENWSGANEDRLIQISKQYQ
jgi:hypothetical protein